MIKRIYHYAEDKHNKEVQSGIGKVLRTLKKVELLDEVKSLEICSSYLVLVHMKIGKYGKDNGESIASEIEKAFKEHNIPVIYDYDHATCNHDENKQVVGAFYVRTNGMNYSAPACWIFNNKILNKCASISDDAAIGITIH
jgi:hypothetical protein